MRANTPFSSLKRSLICGFLTFVAFSVVLAFVLVNHQTQSRQQTLALAAGKVYSASPGDDLMQKVSALQPGDTLLLNDGVYYSPLYIENKAGTATAPITIKAANDGKAIIDGSQITAEWTPPVFIGNGAAYITVEGIVARNAPQSSTDSNVNESVVYVYGKAHDITLRRITAHDAAPGNNHVFYIAFGATNVLVEDCAGWGRGRYIFNAYHVSNVTFRRDWAYQAYTTNFSPAPRSAFGVYGASNVTLENVIGINTIPSQTDDNYYTAAWETTDDATNWPINNTTILGSMFFNNCEGYWVNGSAGQNTQFKDDYFEIPVNNTCRQYTTMDYGQGLRWGSAYGGSITNSTFTNNNLAFFRDGAGTPPISNSVFLNNKAVFQNDSGHSYSDFWNNGTLGTSLVSTDKQVDPGYDTTTYGKGGYLFIPQNSPLKGAGQNGADMGANILYEYVNGQLTNQPLWPWPMEDRIMAEKGISVTWEANGGIWKTLNGVYPNMTVTATPNVTPTAISMPTPTVSPTQSVSSLTPTPTPVPDTVPPTVTITHPANGSTVKRGSTVTISANASDNLGVTKVEFSVNNSLLCTDTTVPYTCRWTVPRKRGITYTLTAKVYDKAGNSTIKTITVKSSS